MRVSISTAVNELGLDAGATALREVKKSCVANGRNARVHDRQNQPTLELIFQPLLMDAGSSLGQHRRRLEELNTKHLWRVYLECGQWLYLIHTRLSSLFSKKTCFTRKYKLGFETRIAKPS